MHSVFPELYPLGDAGIVIRFGEQITPEVHAHVQAMAARLEAFPFEGMSAYVPAYTTVTVYYDPWIVSKQGKHHAYPKVAQTMQDIYGHLVVSEATEVNLVEIPVCYGGKYGPDLAYVAKYHGIAAEEVITLHTTPVYMVYMIGFAPGFPYLGGMETSIATPRKESPRQQVPAGSVGIAGAQTGIYPMETPGGWQLIGRTYVPLFDVQKERPSMLKAGDQVKFVAVSEADYQQGASQ